MNIFRSIASVVIIASVTLLVIASAVFLTAITLQEKHSTRWLAVELINKWNAKETTMVNSKTESHEAQAAVKEPQTKQTCIISPGVLESYQNSVIDYLKQNDDDYSFENRNKLAIEYGVKDYKGTPDQNLALLKSLIMTSGIGCEKTI